MRSKRFIVLLVAMIATGAVLVTVATAAVISRQTLADGEGLRYRFERVSTDASGTDTGWHIHPGLVIVQIEAGSVQIHPGKLHREDVRAG